MGITEVIGNKRDDVLKLASQYGASNVRVFGSVARGEATPESDIDLLGREVSLITDEIPDTQFLSRIAPDVVAL